MRISRKTKNKLRVCFLCLTGNLKESKSKYSKEQWVYLSTRELGFVEWLKVFSFEEIRVANKIR